ncbi:uncharacterized protein [Arachis hypogaea]|uniref:uncharacterized protein n=1 Tax=Arachis hypogaea TaxID=3818 RepID=UPI000DEC984A|nr:uncharacterized protein LOC112735128 [Arachis hypogaea]
MFKESRKLLLGATTVHQFCHLGSFSFLSGGSVVSQDVRKYTMVAGERAELRGTLKQPIGRYSCVLMQMLGHSRTGLPKWLLFPMEIVTTAAELGMKLNTTTVEESEQMKKKLVYNPELNFLWTKT